MRLLQLGAGRIVPPCKEACAVEREPLGWFAGWHVDLEPDPPGVAAFLRDALADLPATGVVTAVAG